MRKPRPMSVICWSVAVHCSLRGERFVIYLDYGLSVLPARIVAGGLAAARGLRSVQTRGCSRCIQVQPSVAFPSSLPDRIQQVVVLAE